MDTQSQANPWTLVLGLVSLLSFAGGVGLIIDAASSAYGTEYTDLTFAYVLIAFGVTVGLLYIVVKAVTRPRGSASPPAA